MNDRSRSLYGVANSRRASVTPPTGLDGGTQIPAIGEIHDQAQPARTHEDLN